MADTVATLQAVITAETAGFEKGLASTKKGLGGFGAAAGAAMGLATKAIDLAIGAVEGLGNATIGAAIKFDKSLKNIQSVTGQTSDQIKALGGELMNIGAHSVAGTQAVTDAYYDVASGVTDASARMATLKAAVALSEAGNASLAASTSALISIMNSYAYSADKAGFASDVLTQTVGVGVGSMESFASALGPISGLAAKVGVKFEELGASAAYLTTKGASASQAATRLQATMTAMLNPNAQMTAALRKSGYASGEAAIKQLGLVGAINALYKASGGSADKMAKMAGSVEALQAMVALAGPEFAGFAEDFANGLDGATAAAQKVQLGSFDAQWKMFTNTLSAAAQAVGMLVLPALNGIISFINGAMGTVGKFAPLITEGIGKIAGIFKPLLDEINRITTPVRETLATVKAEFDFFFDNLFGGDTYGGISKAGQRLSKKLGETLTADTLSEKIGPAFKTLKENLAAELSGIDLISLATGLINAAASFGETLARNILMGILGIGTKISNLLSVSLKDANVDAKLKPITDGVANFITAMSANNFEKPRQLIADIGTAISGLMTTLNGVVTDVSAKLKPIADGIMTFIGSLTANNFAQPKQLMTDIGNALSAFSAKVQPIIDTVAGMVSGTLNSLGTGLKAFIDNLQGTDFSGVAKLLTIIGGALAGLAAVVGTAILGALDGLGKALGPLGSALKDFINALAAAGNGDIGGALKGIGDGLGKLAEGALKIPEGIATKLGGLFGIDVQGGLKAWEGIPEQLGTILSALGTKISEAVTNLPTEIQKLIDTGKAKFGEFVSGVVSKITGLGDELIKAINTELDKVIGGIKDKANQIGAAIAGAITGTGAGAPIPKEPGSTTANPNYDPTKPVLNADGTTAQAPKNKGMDAVLATGKQQRQVAAGGGGATGSTSGGENDAYAYIEGFEGIMEQNGYRLGAAIQSALDSVQVNVTGLSAKLAAMFSGADITAAVTNLGTVVSGALTSTFGADGAVMTALQPFEDSWAQIFGAGGSVAAAATGMQGVIDMLVGSIVSISGTGTPAILEFQAVSTSAAPTIAGAWQPVVGVFRQLLMTLEGIAGAAQRATGAMGAIPGVGGGGGGKGYAEGGYTGSGSSSAVAGVVHKNEYVVPQGGALVMRGGDSGGAISIQNVNVYGVTNPAQMYDAIRKEANRRNA